jgi:general secretion pathway protein J
VRTRSGFTLLEVMVALVITGLVTSVAYAALQGGIDTRERLAHQREHAEAFAVARGLVGNAVRHALPGIRGGPATFTVTRSGASDSVHFLTRGVVEPLGTSGAWAMSLWIVGDTLRLDTRPIEGPGAPVIARIAGVTGLRVRSLARGTFARWADGWADPSLAPTALQLTWTETTGRTQAQVQRIGLERAP